MVNDPPSGFFTVHVEPDKTKENGKLDGKTRKFASKSFHLDTYCFDSVPEQDFFINVLQRDEISEVYFTGMLTHGKSDFLINYIDPDTHAVRSYYPDFLLKTRAGEWIVVEVKGGNMLEDDDVKAKREFAEKYLSTSRISYKMIPHTWAKDWFPGYQAPEQAKL